MLPTYNTNYYLNKKLLIKILTYCFKYIYSTIYLAKLSIILKSLVMFYNLKRYRKSMIFYWIKLNNRKYIWFLKSFIIISWRDLSS